MPTCPGCGGTVEYDRIRHHVRTCPGIWTVEDRETAWNAHLGAETEQLELKLDTLLSALDQLDEVDDEELQVQKPE